ncbi:class I SAM-dependent methyltransferase [Hyphomonas sp.]|uniref:class I SAM-dependent methyltransferase n=1 Tax=Hyphomonas sp. TaxID=87 RepID=UPI00391886E9
MVSPNPVSVIFDEARAEAYDEQFGRMKDIKATLHLLMLGSFLNLSADARILVAGAGTGAEVRFLAPQFPGWRFTLIDPSAPMLAVARRHAAAEGFLHRCMFHADYVSATPVEAHDAATSILVSHFLTDAAARQAYFEDIAARLKPGGKLYTVDLCADETAESFVPIMELWLDLLRHGGVPDDNIEHYRQAYGRDFSAHGPAEFEGLVEAAGFTPPAPVFQAALMRGWIATKR